MNAAKHYCFDAHIQTGPYQVKVYTCERPAEWNWGLTGSSWLTGHQIRCRKKEFTLHLGGGSVYMMTGSTNTHFTHQVTCTPSKSGEWLRVCVPIFLFWDKSQVRVSNKRQRTTRSELNKRLSQTIIVDVVYRLSARQHGIDWSTCGRGIESVQEGETTNQCFLYIAR